MSSDGWEELRLGDVLPLRYGKGLRASERVRSGSVPVYGSNGPFDFHDKTLTNGPVVVVGRKGSIGQVHFVREPCWVGDTAFYVDETDSVDIYFAYCLLSTLRLSEMNTDSAVPGLNRENAHRLLVRLPPLSEQQAIAEVLGSLDDRISLLTEIARTSDRLRETLFEDCVLDSVDRAKWPSVSLDEVCTTQYGFTASASDTAVGPQFVRVTDINKNPWVDWATTPFAEVPPDQLPKYALRPGDILVARMADPGKCALIDSEVDAVFASYLVRIRTRPAGLAQFVYGFLSSREYARYAAGAQYGTVQKNMNARVIVSCDMPLPPQDVIDRYSATASVLRARMAAALEEARAVAELRGALLPRLVSGVLRIEHPERLLDQVS